MNLPVAPRHRPLPQIMKELREYEALRLQHPEATATQKREMNDAINRLEIESREVELSQTKHKINLSLLTKKKLSKNEEHEIHGLLLRVRELEDSLQIRKNPTQLKVAKKKGGTRKSKKSKKSKKSNLF